MQCDNMAMAALPALVRYALTALILLVIGTFFVHCQLLSDGRGERAALWVLDGRTVAVGQPAPDFALRDLDGRVVRLSGYRGQTVVLNFWASWCGPCRVEMPELLRAYEQRRASGDLVVLAVDRLHEDSEGAVRAFVREFGLSFPVLLDADEEVVRRFNVTGLPATFFIDRDGVVRAIHVGPVLGELLTQGIAAADAGGG